MVSYDDFKEFMRIKAEEETGGRAKVSRVRKLNGVVLDGLTIMTTESNISPTIYLNEFYDYFKNAKESDDEAIMVEMYAKDNNDIFELFEIIFYIIIVI